MSESSETRSESSQVTLDIKNKTKVNRIYSPSVLINYEIFSQYLL